MISVGLLCRGIISPRNGTVYETQIIDYDNAHRVWVSHSSKWGRTKVWEPCPCTGHRVGSSLARTERSFPLSCILCPSSWASWCPTTTLWTSFSTNVAQSDLAIIIEVSKFPRERARSLSCNAGAQNQVSKTWGGSLCEVFLNIKTGYVIRALRVKERDADGKIDESDKLLALLELVYVSLLRFTAIKIIG